MTTNTVESFLERYRNDQRCQEGRLAAEYTRIVFELSGQHARLISCLRAEMRNVKIIPIFNEDALSIIGNFNTAEQRVRAMRSDIEEFCNLCSGMSIKSLGEKLHRERRKIADAERNTRLEAARAIRLGKSDESVQKLYDRRDAIVAEAQPIVDQLMERLKRANSIIDRYA